MKKYALILMALLCLIRMSNAQQLSKNVLQPGDKAPPFRVFKHIKGDTVSSFEDGKIHVIEFGATWCSPCRALVPKLSALAAKYKDKISVYSCFVMEYNGQPSGTKEYDYVAKVKKYIAKQGEKINYSAGIDGPDRRIEEDWLKAAGKTGVPYTFIIDENGRIASITVNPDELEKNITNVLNHKPKEKTVTGKDEKSVALTQVQNIDTTVIFRSSLSRFVPGQPRLESLLIVENFFWANKQSPYFSHRGKVHGTGESLRRLYYMAYGDTLLTLPLQMDPGTGHYLDTIKFPGAKRAYGKFWHKPIFEMIDSSAFNPDIRYNYELVIPRATATAKNLQRAMRKDLEAAFGFSVSIETRLMPVWLLTVPEIKKGDLKAKSPDASYNVKIVDSGSAVFQSSQTRDLIVQLEILFGYSQNFLLMDQPLKEPPFIDATGLTGKIDYEYRADFTKKLMDSYDGGAEFTFADYREMLKIAGFDLNKGYRRMKVMVIRAPKL